MHIKKKTVCSPPALLSETPLTVIERKNVKDILAGF